MTLKLVIIEFAFFFSCLLFIHSITIASLLLFTRDPVCFCFISGAKVVRVLEQKQGRAFQVLPKNLHPSVFFQLIKDLYKLVYIENWID